MATGYSILSGTPLRAQMGTAGILDVPKKLTVIRLRWLVVIICSYLLLSSHGTWVAPAFVNSFILFYIASNLALYFAVS